MTTRCATLVVPRVEIPAGRQNIPVCQKFLAGRVPHRPGVVSTNWLDDVAPPLSRHLVHTTRKTSIRASYGIFNSIIEGNTIGVDEPQPPYGLSDTVYNGLFAAPYNLADGTLGIRLRFPP